MDSSALADQQPPFRIIPAVLGVVGERWDEFAKYAKAELPPVTSRSRFFAAKGGSPPEIFHTDPYGSLQRV